MKTYLKTSKLILVLLLATGCPDSGSDKADVGGSAPPDAGPVCPPGSLGCACREGPTCDGFLECAAGTCVLPKTVLLTVGNASVRACDLLLEESGRAITGAQFGADTLGEQQRQGTKVAVSFTSKADVALGSGAVAIGLTGAEAPSVNPPKLSAVQCFDRSGAVVAQPDLKLQ